MGWSIARTTGLTHHQPGLSTEGYTLLTPHGDTAAYLVDMDGRVVHRWEFSDIKPGYGRLLSNGNLLMSGQDLEMPDRPEDNPTEPPPPFEVHVTRLGGYHTILVEVDWAGDVVWEYRNAYQHHDFYRFANGNTMVPEWVELSEELHEEVIGGYSRPGEQLPRLLGDDLVEVDRDGNEVRRIHTWELFDPVVDPIGPTRRRWEWTHVNGFDVNESGDNIQVFDNGRDSSRVVEIDPDSGEIVWEFKGSPGPQFFSGHISGASRLDSGNVLVCEGTSGRLFEVTPDKEVVWEWINPFVNTNSRGEPSTSIYRAHRYRPDFAGLAGLSLDPGAHSELNESSGLI